MRGKTAGPDMGRMDRRRLNKWALGAGLSAPALGAALAAIQRGAAQEGTPSSGEPVVTSGDGFPDLANLSPDIPEPTEPVTVTFASWVERDADDDGCLRDRFQELHPNITVEFQGVPAEEMDPPAHDPDRRRQSARLASTST